MIPSSLSCFTPHVQMYLSMILKRGRVGLSPGSVKISNGMSSCSPYDSNAMCDRFKVTVPYGGQTISWDVLFWSKRSDVPPDFIFTDDNFPIELDDLEELCNWNAKDSLSLLSAIKEVLKQYGKYQVMQLSKHSRTQFEYSTLLQQEGFTDEDIEIYVSPKARGPVNFLIRLPIDFSKLPPLLTRDNPDEDSALLLVIFQTPEGSRVTPQLFLSPNVEHALGGAQQWRIPSFPSDGCLMDYVPCMMKLLEKRVEQITESFEKRKEYLSAFITHFEGGIIEYDAESFTKLSLLLEWNDFYFLLHISLGIAFPIDKPSLSFQSIYHKTGGKPYTVTTADYPYSPRWSVQEMLQRAKCFLQEYIPIFQTVSVKK